MRKALPIFMLCLAASVAAPAYADEWSDRKATWEAAVKVKDAGVA
jgi:hypothetical protein